MTINRNRVGMSRAKWWDVAGLTFLLCSTLQNAEDFQYSRSHQMHKITWKFAHINTPPTPLWVSLQIKSFKTMSNISEASLVPTPSKLILPTPTVTTVLIITRLKSFSNLPYLHMYTFKNMKWTNAYSLIILRNRLLFFIFILIILFWFIIKVILVHI